MSRGLGVEQRRFLHAIAALEAKHGRRWILVWGVVDAVWNDELEVRPVQREAAYQAWVLAEKARETTDRELAAAGDEQAKIRVEHWSALRGLAGLLRRGNRIHYNHLRRNNPGAEAMLNPSRVLAGLERRGLVMRLRGEVALTDAGRVMARTLSKPPSALPDSMTPLPVQCEGISGQSK